MSEKVLLEYPCDSNDNDIKLSLELEEGLWSVSAVNHKGIDVRCDDPPHACADTFFKNPIHELVLDKATDAIFFESRINSTIAAANHVREVKMKLTLEGGKKKHVERITMKKKPGTSAKLRVTIQYIPVLVLLLCKCILFAQPSNGVVYEIDNMRAPANAAATLLGIEESAIKMIENPTDFSALLQSNKEEITSLPSNFGFQINPFGAFLRDPKPAETYLSNKFGDNLAKTSLISFAFSDSEDDGLSQGLGYQFSISKGKVKNKDLLIEKVDLLYQQLAGITALEEQNEKVDSLKAERLIIIGKLQSQLQQEVRDTAIISILRVEMQDLGDQIDDLQDEIFLTDASINMQKKTEELATQLFDAQENRSGLRLDFSAAMVLQFPERTIGLSKIDQVGAWLTFSPNATKYYEEVPVRDPKKQTKYHDWFGLIRYQKQPDFLIAENLTEDLDMIDAGVKYLYRWDKIRIGGEGIFRNLFSVEADEIDNTSFRYLLDTSYNIGNNNYLSFSYGKDFDEQTIQNGNVIAAINFIKGFGKKRPVIQ